jgi:hypothetical protein
MERREKGMRVGGRRTKANKSRSLHKMTIKICPKSRDRMNSNLCT